MPTYRLTLSCGHSRTLESETTPTAKNPSCPDCPPDPKYGKVQRPVVLVELSENGGWSKVERADLPTTPRGPRVPSVPTSQLVAAVKEAIEYVSQARWATGAPLLETPVLDSIAALWAPAEETPVVEAPPAPPVVTNGNGHKVLDEVARVHVQHQQVDEMSRRECLAYLDGRGYASISRKRLGELREMVLAEMGVAV